MTCDVREYGSDSCYDESQSRKCARNENERSDDHLHSWQRSVGLRDGSAAVCVGEKIGSYLARLLAVIAAIHRRVNAPNKKPRANAMAIALRGLRRIA